MNAIDALVLVAIAVFAWTGWRQGFVTGLLEERDIPVVPLGRLAEWAQRMRPSLLAPNGH